MPLLYALLLLFIAAEPTTASQPDGVMCSEVAEVYDEAVRAGVITNDHRDELIDRCIYFYGE